MAHVQRHCGGFRLQTFLILNPGPNGIQSAWIYLSYSKLGPKMQTNSYIGANDPVRSKQASEAVNRQQSKTSGPWVELCYVRF